MKLQQSLLTLRAASVALSLVLTSSLLAKGGATDPIPGTSNRNGGTTSGGGGGKNSSTTPAPAPAPTPAPVVQPIVSKTITFTCNSLAGSVPSCSGNYRIDPYYPTLSLMTVSVNLSGASVPDGTNLFLYVNGLGGTLYPFTSNVLPLTAGSGTVTENIYITPGTTIDSIVVTDASGAIVATGL